MCDAKDGLHIAEDQIYVETVDIHTGEVIPNGEVGELVYTTLRKKARPMIRFRTGDIGRIDQTPCSCGRTHGRIHILGRKDDMFIVSAVNVFPSDIEAVIRGIKGITGEYPALPWNIYGDQRDSMGLLDQGWIQLYVENAQEALDMSLVAYRVAEDSRVLTPFMINMDGFVLTHTYEVVDIPDQELADRFLPSYVTDNRFDFDSPKSMLCGLNFLI